ncbi:hypothetical protein LCGC14_1662180 [marine sediment metagenome]|uniref:DUF5658 domain-containing protein n=1 Tax=marine sediment metagenome TaxID=412755 RepID=A0A0F9IG73_9ZZZZ
MSIKFNPYFSNIFLKKRVILNLISFFSNTLEGKNQLIILGIFLIILQISDIITTNIGIKNGCEEGNPILKKKLNSGFPVYLIIIKIGIASLVTFLLSIGMMILNWIFLALDIFLLIVIVNNVIGIHTQKKWNRIYNIETGKMMKFKQFFIVREWISLTQH